METGAPELTARETLLLLFLAAGEQELDPVRIQKGLFLLTKKTPPEWLADAARYEFKPYNYGPFAPQIYTDLSNLRRLGYVQTGESWNPSWRFHSVSATGRLRAEDLSQSVSPDLLAYVARVRQFVTEQSFSDLLRAIYREYPEYAVNSVFQY